MISGSAPLERALDRARDLLAHDDAHAAADEAVFHRGHHDLDAVEPARGDDHRVLRPVAAFARPKAIADTPWCP